MEPTPTEAAIEEQQQREAAFARARATLSAIRTGQAGGWRNTPIAAKNLILSHWWYIVWAVMLFLCAYGLVNLHGWEVTAWDDPVQILWLACILLGGLAVSYAAFKSAVNMRRMHPAERLLHDFYEKAGGDGVPVNLERFVIEADAERSDRRTPDVDTGASVLRAPGIADNLNRYWHNLLKPAGRRHHTAHVKSVRIHELAPDLVLASVTTVVSRALSLWVYVVAVVGWVLMTSFVEDNALVLASGGYGLAIGVLAVWYFRRAGRGRTHTVRKLVVKSNNQWRMFCGDWEGWEERDLSWLDDLEPSAPAA